MQVLKNSKCNCNFKTTQTQRKANTRKTPLSFQKAIHKQQHSILSQKYKSKRLKNIHIVNTHKRIN